MNFFEWKKSKLNSKEGHDNVHEDLSSGKELVESEGDIEFGPYRTAKEKNDDRRHLLELVAQRSKKEEKDKEWTEGEIERLKKEINDKLDKQNPQ